MGAIHTECVVNNTPSVQPAQSYGAAVLASLFPGVDTESILDAPDLTAAQSREGWLVSGCQVRCREPSCAAESLSLRRLSLTVTWTGDVMDY